MTCIKDILHEDFCTFMVPDWVLLRTRSVPDKSLD